MHNHTVAGSVSRESFNATAYSTGQHRNTAHQTMPRPSQPTIALGSVNEYQLQLGFKEGIVISAG